MIRRRGIRLRPSLSAHRGSYRNGDVGSRVVGHPNEDAKSCDLTVALSGEHGEAVRVHYSGGLDRSGIARGRWNAGRGTAGTRDPKRALAQRGREGRPARSLATRVERASKEEPERRRWRSGRGAPERRCEKLRSNVWRQRRAKRVRCTPGLGGTAVLRELWADATKCLDERP